MIGCSIQTCDSLRLGVTVNIIFVLIGLGVLLLVRIAHSPPAEIRKNVKLESRGLLVHAGYTLHLAAGCAFFGALSLTELRMDAHAAFAFAWLSALLMLLVFEFVMAKLKGSSTEFSLARIVSIPMSIAFVCWVCGGAKWPG
jgi:hypothetical protein